jgi:hypothetical protein
VAPYSVLDVLPMYVFQFERSNPPIFGQPVDDAVKRSRWDIPAPLQVCVDFLKKLEGQRAEGIFRIAGLSTKIDELVALFDADEEIIWDCDVHTVASVFKKYVRELPEPVIPSSYLERYVKVLEVQDKHGLSAAIQYHKDLILEFSEIQRRLALFVFSFLYFVFSFEKENRVSFFCCQHFH